MHPTRSSTSTQLQWVDKYVCFPWMLLLNFAIFQYLTTTYFDRRREIRVKLLIASAFVGFFTLTLFAHPNDAFVQSMNDLSEVATVLTFLLQIAITCRGVLKRVKVKSLLFTTYLAEFLIVLDMGFVVVSLIDNFIPHTQLSTLAELDFIVEHVSLVFVFGFRFYMSAMNLRGGWRQVWRDRKLEVVLYLMLVTHVYPFVLLEHATDLHWDYVEGLYERILVVGCLGLTLREKIRSSNTRRASNEDAMLKKRRPQILPMPPKISDLPSSTTTAILTK